jgi:nucleoside-triphosphatase THEP1
MELFSKQFGDRVLQMFREDRPLLVTIPVKPLPFVNRLKSENPAAVIVEVIG